MKSNYDPISEWKWKSYYGDKEVDIKSFLNAIDNNSEIYIGTDSQNYSKGKKRCIFTSAVIIYKRGLGGRILFHRDTTAFQPNLRERLLMEAMRSLECAWFVQNIVSDETPMYIHLDVNESLKFKSGKYRDELVGLIAAQGFKALCKPYSWAASGIADSRT